MSLPLAAVPLPAGRPRPSGNTVMSMALTLSSLAGLPMRPSSPNAANSSCATPANLSALRNMRHAPIRTHIPDLDLIIVIAIIAPARRQHFVRGRLQISRVIGCPRLQSSRTAIPSPRQTEPRECFREPSLLQPCVFPSLAVHRNLDALNLPAPRPCQARDLVRARAARHLLPARRTRDH